MKNILMFFVLAMSFAKVYSQDERLDELPFKEEETIEEKAPYFGLGGGFTGTYLMLNNDELNKFSNANGFESLEKPFLTGGQGFTGVPWVKNLRVGISGFGGTQTASKSKQGLPEIDSNGNPIKNDYVRKVEQQISNIGLSLGYGIIITKSLAVIPELTISSASHKIVYKNTLATDYDFTKITPGSPGATMNTMESSFIALTPSINVEWAVTSLFMARVSAGYNYQLKADWKWDGEKTMANVPSGLNTNGAFVQIGLFLGLFNY